MTPRKRPHCHTCGSPMAGHKRRNGTPVCPEDSDSDVDEGTSTQVHHHHTDNLRDEEEELLVPNGTPPSPPPSPRSSPARGQRRRMVPEVVIPTNRSWRRRNPNWVDPNVQARARIVPIDDVEEDGSVVSTVLNSDHAKAESNQDLGGGFEDEEGEDENYHPGLAESSSTSSSAVRSHGSISLIDRVLSTSTPLASLFSTPAQDVANLQLTARELGLHTGLLRKPRNVPDSAPGPNRVRFAGMDINMKDGSPLPPPIPRQQGSFWMVVGRSGEAVRHLLDIHQRDMPGRLDGDDGGVRTIVMQGRKGVGFLQLLIAGAIGGFVVVYLLSAL
ncbi:hypothetical protein JAAARDRAFT_219765 [Jaapia argillacea MUCL 33604]|uniref:Uncharacterized protein n=1 Tax=Jaapia argillacea MUCL 33604 TaxID=933084 RepID=A0A067QB69_9AGAM|nr:hypothetical protein JAAARDRAFT_219765 [Jaapia argillacea MUCL 33604]